MFLSLLATRLAKPEQGRAILKLAHAINVEVRCTLNTCLITTVKQLSTRKYGCLDERLILYCLRLALLSLYSA
jgi:hypothetical protein